LKAMTGGQGEDDSPPELIDSLVAKIEAVFANDERACFQGIQLRLQMVWAFSDMRVRRRKLRLGSFDKLV
jgi:hypothetical protein